MQVAISFKTKQLTDLWVKELQKRNFNVNNECSIPTTIWVYGIVRIDWGNDIKTKLVLNHSVVDYIELNLKDIEYYEVYNR